jgi:hypothetical protein
VVQRPNMGCKLLLIGTGSIFRDDFLEAAPSMSRISRMSIE